VVIIWRTLDEQFQGNGSTRDTHYTATNLEPNRAYIFRLYAKIQDGRSPYIEAVTFLTGKLIFAVLNSK